MTGRDNEVDNALSRPSKNVMAEIVVGFDIGSNSHTHLDLVLILFLINGYHAFNLAHKLVEYLNAVILAAVIPKVYLTLEVKFDTVAVVASKRLVYKCKHIIADTLLAVIHTVIVVGASCGVALMEHAS